MFKLEKHKSFDYTPLYYKPEKDPDVKRRERLNFRRASPASSPFSKKFIFLFLLIFLILYLLKKLAILF